MTITREVIERAQQRMLDMCLVEQFGTRSKCFLDSDHEGKHSWELRCFYLGCWNEPGHGLHSAGDGIVGGRKEFLVLDGALAPRRDHGSSEIVFGESSRRGPDGRMRYSSECPQGHFLRHDLDSGFTAIQWWDRCQGDTRPGSNSTILLEGRHTTNEMLLATEEFFHQVLTNLARKGIELVEVHR